MTYIKHFIDLGYSVKATVADGAYVANYEIFRIIGTMPECLVWHDEAGDPVEDFGRAYCIMEIGVKWDGCSNWTHTEIKDDAWAHECDRRGLVNTGLILAACWGWTKEILPTWDTTL